MNLYQSDYPNQVHQLVVSVSKHLYVTKAGRMNFQKKAMEVSLETVNRSDKVHVIHYVIRDHFSGLVYAELCPSTQIIPVETFLRRAWSKKEGHVFCGVPDALTIPKTVSAVFPEVSQFVRSLGIDILVVTSGFQGGVRDIRTLEERLAWYAQAKIEEEEWQPFKVAQGKIHELVADLNGDPSDWGSKARRWTSKVGELRVPSPR